jgi:formylglycine-generating enzyme required for sulfatase activity
MVDGGRFCIDRYEAPNRYGAHPIMLATADDGARWCSPKRLCSDAEWTAACADTPAACNDRRPWRPVDWGLLGRYPAPASAEHARALDQADPSGAHRGCISAIGAVDMLGNVAEWVQAPAGLRGGFWSGVYGGGRPSCTFANRTHPPSFRTYEAGFRCCASVPE